MQVPYVTICPDRSRRRRDARHWILLSCLCLHTLAVTPVGLPAQTEVHVRGRIARDYIVTQWTTEDGLPQNSVTGIIQSTDGFLWIGTFGGLVRFDGVNLDVFDISNTPAMPSNRINSLSAGAGGTVWIGFAGGTVVRYSDGRFRRVHESSRSLGGAVFAVLEGEAGEIWVGTEGGLFRSLDNSLELVSKSIDSRIHLTRALLRDRTGTIWAGIGPVLARVDGDTIAVAARLPGSITAMTEGLGGTIWLAAGARVYSLHEERLVEQPRPGTGAIRSLTTDGGNRVWAGAAGAVVVGREKEGKIDRWTTVWASSGALQDLSHVLKDAEKNLWLGTRGEGLLRLRGRPVWRYTTRNGLPRGDLRAVTIDAAGVVWVGSVCGGLSYIRNDTVYRISPNAVSPPLKCVSALWNDTRGRLWIGHGGRVTVKDRSGYSTYSGRQIGVGGIGAIFEDRDGVIWMGGTRGVATFDGKRFTRRADIGSAAVRTITQTRDGAIWIGTAAGATRVLGGEVTFLSHDRDPAFPRGPVRAIYEDPDGAVWFGTYGGGLARLRDGDIRGINADAGLSDNSISSILPDRNDNLWISSNLGLSYVPRSRLEDVIDGKTSMIHPVIFRKTDGAVEASGGTQPAGWRGPDGRLWFTTIDGIEVVDPAKRVANQRAPPVVVLGAFGTGKPLPERDTIVLRSGNAHLEIDYTAPSFVRPELVRFRYQLAGSDPGWIDAGSRRSAFYTNLPAGHFVFRVIAANDEGVWNEQGAAVAITVVPPFWATFWFRLLSLVVGGAVLVQGYRYSTRRIREKAAVLQREIDERRRVESSLRESEGRLRRAQQLARLGYWEWDVVNGSQHWSDEAYHVYGYDPGAVEPSFENFLNAVHPDDRARVKALADGILNGREVEPTEFRVVHQDGNIHTVWSDANLTRRNGRLVKVEGMVMDVTERKQVAAELEQSNKRLELAVNASQLGMWEWDIREDTVTWDRRMCEIFGVNQGEVGDFDAFLSRVHAEDRQRVQESVQSTLNTGAPYDTDCRIIRNDGSIRHIMAQGLMTGDEGGRPIRMTGVCLDVTDRQQAQEVIRQRGERLLKQHGILVKLAQSVADDWGDFERSIRRITETVSEALNVDRVGVWLFDAERNAMMCKDLFERSAGKHTAGAEVLESDHPSYFKAIKGERVIAAADARSDPRTAEFVDSLVSSDVTAVLDAPIRLGGVTMGVVCHEHITTAREWQPEEEIFAASVGDFVSLALEAHRRTEVEKALRASEEKLRLALQASRMGTWSWDVTSGTLTWSADVAGMLGLEPLEFDGTREMYRRLMHPDDVPNMESAIQKTLSDGKQYLVEYRILLKDGSIRWIQERGQAYFDSSGKALRMTGTILDITDIMDAQAERDRLIEELETKNAELERFTYTVSHDLKSPLVTIKGFLGLLERDARAGDGERVQKDVMRISEAAAKMQRLLDELLELSRIGRIVTEPQDVPLDETVSEALEMVGGDLRERDVTIEVLDHLPVIVGDRMRVVEVFQNLIQNAVKFMGDQSDPRIVIGCRETPDHYVVFVEDNGMGIDPKYHSKIFGLFDRLSAESEGTGVGLALVKRIVEVHGGSVWVESKGENRGSTFFVAFPRPEQA